MNGRCRCSKNVKTAARRQHIASSLHPPPAHSPSSSPCRHVQNHLHDSSNPPPSPAIRRFSTHHHCKPSPRESSLSTSSSERISSSSRETRDGGEGGGCPAGSQQVLGEAADRHGGAGRLRRQGLQGAAAGAAVRARGAQVVVLLPRRDRRVHGHLPLPLHHHPHRHGGQQLHLQVRHRRHPGHRLVLRRHDLRPRLLHRRHLRRPHQPGGHLRALPRQEAVAHQGRLLHGNAVPRRHLRRRRRQGLPEGPVRDHRRRRQHRRARLHQGRRPRRRDRRHLHPRLHRLLRHRRQEERQGLPCSDPCPAANRVCGVLGSPGHHPHHRHRHQPSEEPWRCHHLQQGPCLG